MAVFSEKFILFTKGKKDTAHLSLGSMGGEAYASADIERMGPAFLWTSDRERILTQITLSTY